MDSSHIQAILDWLLLTTVSEVRAFLGTCGVLQIFIKDYTLVARPLINLTCKDEPFKIGPAQLASFEQLKLVVAHLPALCPINYKSDLPVIFAINSCMNGIGFILLQVREDRKRYPSQFGSIVFNDCESRYSQAKLKLFRLFHTLKQTQLFTIGVKNFIIEMDAKFIKGMLNSPALHPNDAVNLWVSAILLFDFELVHVPTAKHTGADNLSQHPQAAEDPDAEEPDELDNLIDSNAGFFIKYNSPDSAVNPAPPMVFATASDNDTISTIAPSITLSPS